MQWLNELPFGDNRVVQIGILAACGIAALVVLAIIYRLVFAHRLRVPGGRTRQPRLGLVDAFSLDGQRQLVLVRRDNVEHLVMIGGPNDVLVESQINRALAPARENNLASPSQAATGLARRVEPAALAPTAPAASAAQKVDASPSSSAPPAQTGKLAPPLSGVSTGDVRSERPPPSVSAPGTRTPSPVLQAPSAGVRQAPNPAQAPPAGEPAAPDPPAPIAAKVPDSARPIPASPPESRSVPARPSMPAPIPPPGATAGRGNVMRPADATVRQVQPASSGVPAASRDAALIAPRPTKAETPTADARPTTGATPSQAPAIGRKETPASGSASADPPSRNTEINAAARNFGPTSIEKTQPKAEDPFAGLDSLEAEMARLLGRDKPG